MLDRVFVYGTLRSGASNTHRMQGARLIGSARVRATLYRVDWYPGLKLRPRVLGDNSAKKASEEPWVLGEIYEVDRGLMAQLDDYEGPEYHRVRVDAELLGAGQELQSPTNDQVYEWEDIAELPGSQLIESGDWLNQ